MSITDLRPYHKLSQAGCNMCIIFYEDGRKMFMCNENTSDPIKIHIRKMKQYDDYTEIIQELESKNFYLIPNSLTRYRGDSESVKTMYTW